MNELFNDPAKQANDPFVEFLQTSAEKETKENIARQLAERILAISQAQSQLLACREWIHELAVFIGSLRVVLLGPPDTTRQALGRTYHPCFRGLAQYADKLVPLHFAQEYARSGSFEGAIESLKVKNSRAHFDLRVAGHARILLNDYREGEDVWLGRYIGVICACWEDNFRQSLALPSVCEAAALLMEQMDLEANVRSGRPNPLGGVKLVPDRDD